ncbi:MAG: hypothetical protein CVU24_01690 [Betaproteobacteria bacterium HGW-Betaproteobacteria-18]|nr:MAG: hypothetical protein CVU24_01690 [Betaproteobacteria bacterium HGW-Betaproteobacteria-18]
MKNCNRLPKLWRWMLAWFVISLGVAVASPMVKPAATGVICTSTGAFKVVVQSDDGAVGLGALGMDCPLCLVADAPPATLLLLPHALPAPAFNIQPIPIAPAVASTAVPPPARAPPIFSVQLLVKR